MVNNKDFIDTDMIVVPDGAIKMAKEIPFFDAPSLSYHETTQPTLP